MGNPNPVLLLGPVMLRPCAAFMVISLAASWMSASAAETGDTTTVATRIAAAIIAERAREQALSGGGPIAAQLDTLARALAAGQVSLYDAALVMHIAMAGAMAPPKALTASAPKVTPEQVVAILDGNQPPSVAAAPAAAAATAEAPPVPPTAGAPAATPLGSVLAIGRGSDGKTSLVMVSAGIDKHLAKGQHLLVMRNTKLIAQLAISDLRDTMAVCVVLSASGPVDSDIKEGDAVFTSNE